MNQPLISLTDVSRRYENFTALEALSFQVNRGEFIAITGPSGCGKSTLLNLLGAIDLPSAGALCIAGENTAKLNDKTLTALRRTQLGYIFQFFNLLPTLTIAENIGLPLALAKNGSAQQQNQLVKDWAEQVGLSHCLNHFPATLSGGEMQRAAIARALIHKPNVVLADEPTGNLDSENGEAILNLMRRLNQENGQTFIMATHSLEAAERATRHIKMRDGRILSDSGLISSCRP